MENAEKLTKLRDVMAVQGLDVFLVPRTDEYQGEFIHDSAQRLAWLTGFTGSAGMGVVLQKSAMVMSDGRYTIQLAQQVDQGLYVLENTQKIQLKDWLKKEAQDMVVGYDPKLHTASEIKALEDEGITCRAVSHNLIDMVWDDRPEEPKNKVELFPEKYAGRTALDKIREVQTQMQENGADALVLSMSDSIAWLLNIRGSDVANIPVVHAFVIVPKTGKAQIFIAPEKVGAEVQNALKPFVEFHGVDDMQDALEGLAMCSVWLDDKRSSVWFSDVLTSKGAKIIAQKDPVIDIRARKNPVEQAAMRQAHIRDGVAVVRFLKWFEENALSGQLTEIGVEEKLESFRAQAPEFKGPSFDTIAGYGGNGAIVHYRATKQSNQTIKAGNLLLLDSGAQYEDGTTDITRTLPVGEVSEEMKRHFTHVLKGHIALATARFDHGITGKELDEIARQPLLDAGIDYAHGTGHGVGCYLSVHEEATSISPREKSVVEDGMILSNEPGYYKEGEYGIRIESLILTRRFDDDMGFDTLTLVPLDKRLICTNLLSAAEKTWVDEYHQTVYKTLSPLLDQETVLWLEKATAPMTENLCHYKTSTPSARM